MKTFEEIQDQYRRVITLYETEVKSPETTGERLSSLRLMTLALSWVLDETPPAWTEG